MYYIIFLCNAKVWKNIQYLHFCWFSRNCISTVRLEAVQNDDVVAFRIVNLNIIELFNTPKQKSTKTCYKIKCLKYLFAIKMQKYKNRTDEDNSVIILRKRFAAKRRATLSLSLQLQFKLLCVVLEDCLHTYLLCDIAAVKLVAWHQLCIGNRKQKQKNYKTNNCR